MLKLGEPKIIERGPYGVVGAYCTYEGEDEGPGWTGADQQFWARKSEITNRADDMVLGFLYRPHRDHPEVPEDVKACFVGVQVSDLDHVPVGMATTRFSGGQYVTVECRGDTADEAAMGVGEAIGMLGQWLTAHGYVEGDACFAAGHEKAKRPPFIEYVFMKIEKQSSVMRDP